jgi:hypothetical protein
MVDRHARAVAFRVVDRIKKDQIHVLNVAGDRESKSPMIWGRTGLFLSGVFHRMVKAGL